jgi:hypothetical protein
MRFKILTSPLWRYFLLPLGANAERSFLEVADGQLHVRFGWPFKQSFALDEIEGASSSHWPVLGGIGWRTNFRGNVGLIGTYVNIVEIRFKQPQRVRMFIPLTCNRLYVSLEEPRDFIAALGKAGERAERPKKEPVAAGANSRPRPRRRKKSG